MQGRGLGLAYVGSRENVGVARLIEILEENEVMRAHVQWHLENVAQLSCRVWHLSCELEQLKENADTKDDRGLELSRVNEDVSRLRQTLKSVEVERDDLKRVLKVDGGGDAKFRLR